MPKKYESEDKNIKTNDATDLKGKVSFERTNEWITSSDFDAFTFDNDINLLNSSNKYIELTRSKPNEEEIQFLESNNEGYINLCAITDIPGCKKPCSICDSCNCTHITDTPSLITSDVVDNNCNNSDSADAYPANDSKDFDHSPILPLTKIIEVEEGDLNPCNNSEPSSLKQCKVYDSSRQTNDYNDNRDLGPYEYKNGEDDFLISNVGHSQSELNKNKGSIDGKIHDPSLAENSNEGENSEILDSESEIIDDDHDKDFNPDDCCSESSNKDSELSTSNCEEDGDNDKLLSKNIDDSNMLDMSLAEKIKAIRQQEKKTAHCKYCKNDIVSKNFMRHLERSHINEKEVKSILDFPKNSKERRQAMALLRNETNFELYIQGNIRPYRQIHNITDKDIMYYPCAYCKGLFLKQYLKRHAKSCLIPCKVKGNKANYLSASHTITACALDTTNVISRLNVKEKVFDLMKGDEIAFESKKDLLIANFGESYLKKHRRERMTYVCSNKMRELGRLLISYREIVNDKNITFKDILCPKNFDLVLSAVRKVVNYDPIKKTFQSPSLAMHLGTSLKEVCDELYHLILKESTGFTSNSAYTTKLWLQSVESFKKLVESRWNTELASLANKDLQEKRWKKPLLLPLVSDVKKFRDEVLKFANDCEKTFADCKDNESTYKTLVQCTLALLIIFNRRRIGDVQFLKIVDYNDNKKTNFKDFENALSETEKFMTTKYKRVLNSGKGSRAVVILVPEILQNFINTLLKYRIKYISQENEYVFAVPKSKIQWGKGDVALRTLANKINLKHPEAMSSNKLRKQIATVMQILNLTQHEAKQFSNFMGHTQKTHDEFYELPIDIYQTAKISKLLLMIEKGTIPVEYKGKSLSEIDFDPDLEYAEEQNR